MSYFAKPCAKTLGYISTKAFKGGLESGSHIKNASQVMTTVQLKPKMDMKPKFRCYLIREDPSVLLVEVCRGPNLQHGTFA